MLRLGGYPGELLLELYNESLKIHGDDYEILKKLSKFCVTNHDNQGSLEYLKRALSIKNDDKDLWFHRGKRELNIAYDENKLGTGHKYCNFAIKSFQKAMRHPAKNSLDKHYNASNYFYLARAYFLKFETKKAEDACLNGLEENPHFAKLESFLHKVRQFL